MRPPNGASELLAPPPVSMIRLNAAHLIPASSVDPSTGAAMAGATPCRWEKRGHQLRKRRVQKHVFFSLRVVSTHAVLRATQSRNYPAGDGTWYAWLRPSLMLAVRAYLHRRAATAHRRLDFVAAAVRRACLVSYP